VKLPTQLWLSDSGIPTPDLCWPVRNDDSHWKPRGGMWTSTLTDDGRSDWWEWCRGEGFGDYSTAWILEPADCRVFEVATPTDLETLEARYRKTDGSMADYINSFKSDDPKWDKEYTRLTYGGWGIDYEKVAEEWDAIWVPTVHAFRMAHCYGMMWFNSMDVESTIWLRFMFESVREADCGSPRVKCKAWTYHVKDQIAECRLDEGHEGMHKCGYTTSFEWSDSFSRHEPREISHDD
jgi:hypothetical protein